MSTVPLTDARVDGATSRGLGARRPAGLKYGCSKDFAGWEDREEDTEDALCLQPPYRLDARRCISYLTIEHDGVIPPELRPAIGNRIFGCDDCQLVCPWNKYAQRATLPDFDVRAPWVEPTLLELWRWDEATFLQRTEGSALRRIGFGRWRRNLAVALGNALRAAPGPGARTVSHEG